MKNRYFLAFIGLIVAFVLSFQGSAAYAASGSMTFNEFGNITQDELRSAATGTRNVEDNCNCTGNVIQTWHTDDGWTHYTVQYFSPYDSLTGYRTALVRYRALGGSGTQYARAKKWCQGVANSWSDNDCVQYSV